MSEQHRIAALEQRLAALETAFYELKDGVVVERIEAALDAIPARIGSLGYAPPAVPEQKARRLRVVDGGAL